MDIPKWRNHWNKLIISLFSIVNNLHLTWLYGMIKYTSIEFKVATQPIFITEASSYYVKQFKNKQAYYSSHRTSQIGLCAQCCSSNTFRQTSILTFVVFVDRSSSVKTQLRTFNQVNSFLSFTPAEKVNKSYDR